MAGENKEVIELTDDNIKKAYETLGLNYDEIVKAKSTEEKNEGDKSPVTKGHEDAESKTKETEEEKKKKEDLEKAEKEKSNKDEDVSEDKLKEMEKAHAESEASLNTYKEKLAKKKKGDMNPETKVGEDDIKKAEVDEIVKAITTDLGGKIDALITLNAKTNDDLSKANQTVATLAERLEALENTPIPKKSFTKTGYIEKAFTENKDNGKAQLSLSGHKKEIAAMLMDKAGFEKGQVVPMYDNALKYFESNGTLSEAVVTDLFLNHKIQINP